MKRTLYFLHNSDAPFKNPSSGTYTPASPCIGSTKNAAIFSASFFKTSSKA
jgi:hypothetical protein